MIKFLYNSGNTPFTLIHPHQTKAQHTSEVFSCATTLFFFLDLLTRIGAQAAAVRGFSRTAGRVVGAGRAVRHAGGAPRNSRGVGHREIPRPLALLPGQTVRGQAAATLAGELGCRQKCQQKCITYTKSHQTRFTQNHQSKLDLYFVTFTPYSVFYSVVLNFYCVHSDQRYPQQH